MAQSKIIKNQCNSSFKENSTVVHLGTRWYKSTHRHRLGESWWLVCDAMSCHTQNSYEAMICLDKLQLRGQTISSCTAFLQWTMFNLAVTAVDQESQGKTQHSMANWASSRQLLRLQTNSFNPDHVSWLFHFQTMSPIVITSNPSQTLRFAPGSAGFHGTLGVVSSSPVSTCLTTCRWADV